ncbi:MAG TPA: GxxExxY protein [Phycisphaerales bacterium]|nr:GxxExxY protein [Phycisphaerales bacterium]
MVNAGELNDITSQIIGAAIDVHRALGPGLLESAYEACLAFDLTARGLRVERQRALPVVYRDVKLDCGYRLDLVVESAVAVELKAVDHVLPIHKAQLLSYLRLSGLKAGLLINFNVKMLKDGTIRLVNDFPDSLRSRRSLR